MPFGRSSKGSKSSRCSRSKTMNDKISGYKKLIVWKEALNLVILVYKLTANFPRSEEFGLKSQMRRASVSIISQIAEGWLRRSIKEKLHYLEIAEGSLLELETQGEVARAVKYWDKEKYEKFNDQRARVAYLLFRYKNKVGA